MSGAKVPHFGVYVPGSSHGGTADTLSAMTGLSMSDARIILASPLPRRLATAVTREEAEERAAALRRAGFDAFAVAFAALRGRPLRAKTARFAAAGVEFQPGGSFAIRLIVHGQIHSSGRVRSDVIARGMVVSKVRTVAKDTEPFLCFFGDHVEQAVEIRPDAFNFRFLGTDVGISKVQSLNAFIDRIRGLHPTVRIDDTLTRLPPSSEYADSGDSIDSLFLSSDTIRQLPTPLQAAALSQGFTASSYKTDSNEKSAFRMALLIAMAALRPETVG